MGNPTLPLLTGWVSAKALPCPNQFSHLELGMVSRLLWGRGESLWVELPGQREGGKMGWLLLPISYSLVGVSVNLSPFPRWIAATHKVSGDKTALGKSPCTPHWGCSTPHPGILGCLESSCAFVVLEPHG